MHLNSFSHHETVASAWQPNGSDNVIFYLILVAMGSVDVSIPPTLKGLIEMDQKWKDTEVAK